MPKTDENADGENSRGRSDAGTAAVAVVVVGIVLPAANACIIPPVAAAASVPALPVVRLAAA